MAVALALLAVSAISLIVYAVLSIYRKRRPNEAPYVKGSLFCGNAAEFNSNAVNFLHRAQKEHGDMFNIRLLNQYLTIIMDPHSYEAMSKEKNFDFDPIQKQVNSNVFSFVLKDARRMIKETGKTVRGGYLSKGMRSFTTNLQMACDGIVSREDPYKTCQNGLRTFASMTMFDALFNTVFGRATKDSPFNSSHIYPHFEVYHKYFNFLWLGLPKKMFPNAMKALEGLLCQPLSEELTTREDISDYIKYAIEYMKAQGQTEAEIKGHNLVYLHVNYNTFRLAFWALYHMLADPKALAALRDEIRETIQNKLEEDPTSEKAVFTQEDLEKMKVLDSVVMESFRMSSGVFMVRYINEDTEFELQNSGVKYTVRKGDRVAIYPPAIHKDPEIYADPDNFQYDRFIDARFYKNGQELKNPIMAFGSLCPGKRYAILQSKWYLLSIFNQFDLELLDGEVAEYDTNYYGHEILPPKQDVQIRYHKREGCPEIDYQ